MSKLLITASDHVFGKAIELVEEHCLKNWRHERAKSFFETLCKELSKESKTGDETSSVDSIIRKLLKNEKTSEALFESYRRVCLSASRTLGPRIIAILTARIAILERQADETEERYFLAAEQLSDTDLAWFKTTAGYTFKQLSEEEDEEKSAHGSSVKSIGEQTIMTTTRPRIPLSVLKLQNLGLFSVHLEGTELIRIAAPREFAGLVDLIERAQGPTP